MREISKGKWRHVKGTGGVAYIMAGDVCIATIHGTQDGKDNETREREAFGNGETMAASGALLSACRAMRQFLIERHGYDSGSTGRRPLCLIEADGAISLSDERLDWLEGVPSKSVDYDVEASDCCEGCGKPMPVRCEGCGKSIPVRLGGGGIWDACSDTYISPEFRE